MAPHVRMQRFSPYNFVTLLFNRCTLIDLSIMQNFGKFVLLDAVMTRKTGGCPVCSKPVHTPADIIWQGDIMNVISII
jgi:hypothetical protein